MSNRFLPPEWHPHESIWLSWPHNPETWYGGSLESAQIEFLEFISVLLECENVNLIVPDIETADFIYQHFKATSLPDRLTNHVFKTNDAWIRDYGADFIIDGSSKLAKCWEFNSWGQKYPYKLDNEVSDFMATTAGLKKIQSEFVFEGGAIEVNGKGICLATESSLLSRNKNNDEFLEELKNDLGIKEFIWLNGTIEGDDTDGHIDNIARFLDEDLMLFADSEDPSFEFNQNRFLLESSEYYSRSKPEIIKVPMPEKIKYDQQVLPASYLNFLIANEVIIFPSYDNAIEDRLKSKIRELRPDREIVFFPSKYLLIGQGSFHCLSKQECLVN